jgi:L-ascorbate metabolism protein UlaG (beta-lactamase superfamily)
MTRLLTATLVAGLLLASAGHAAEEKKVTIRWHGQSLFEIISSAGTRIIIDPHAIEQYGRKNLKADLVLTSHLHTDHTRVEIVENIRECKRIDGVIGQGGKARWNFLNGEKFKDVTLTTVGTYHDEVQGMDRGLNTVWIIEVDGIRIVHLGDLGHLLSEAQVKKIGQVDVLMIPVGGVYTLNGAEAKKVVAQLKPRMYILPMHHGTEVYDDLLPNKEFLDEQNKDNIKSPEKGTPRNELIVKSDFKPAEPIIYLLHWTEK